VRADRKVVVTGIGPVTAVGTGIEEFWAGIAGGRNGVRTITRFDTSDLSVSVAGEVPDFDPAAWLDPKEARRTDRFTQFAIASAKLAWEDAGNPEVLGERGGAVYATGIGGIQTLINAYDILQEKGPGRISPFMVPMLMANAPAGHIAMLYGLTGPNLCTISACASSNHAVGEGMRLIRDGYLDLCVVGGAESATMRLTVAAFAQMTALTKNPDPETASRPFDAERDGFVMSEGAAALVLESEEHAAARGARVYAEVAGYGASADAFHITAPDPKALTIARWGLIPRWAKQPKRINHTFNARAETVAQKGIFKGAFAQRRCLIPIDGFYEWRKVGKSKQPLHVTLQSQRPFSLGKKFKVDAMVEVFNLFNNNNFGQPGRIAVVNSTAFGVITNTRFAPGDSGSSRQLQLAIKLLF